MDTSMSYTNFKAALKGNPRAIARELGELKYVGEDCPYGHGGLRYTRRGQCVECLKISKVKYRNSDHGKAKELDYRKNYQTPNGPKYRASKYGLTADDVEQMKISQDFKCKICENEFDENPKNMHIDHNHNTNKVRGLLCHSCNVGLGCFKDDQYLLFSALKYLQEND